VKPKKRVVKRKSENRKITVSIPEELYFHIKQYAKEDIRTMSQQARFFLEIGLQVIAQQGQECEEDQEPQSEEKEPCIGFRVDRSDDDDEE
jgi:CO dehydrogenase/acetyl-CoA synthase beta subunit